MSERIRRLAPAAVDLAATTSLVEIAKIVVTHPAARGALTIKVNLEFNDREAERWMKWHCR